MVRGLYKSILITCILVCCGCKDKMKSEDLFKKSTDITTGIYEDISSDKEIIVSFNNHRVTTIKVVSNKNEIVSTTLKGYPIETKFINGRLLLMLDLLSGIELVEFDYHKNEIVKRIIPKNKIYSETVYDIYFENNEIQITTVTNDSITKKVYLHNENQPNKAINLKGDALAYHKSNSSELILTVDDNMKYSLHSRISSHEDEFTKLFSVSSLQLSYGNDCIPIHYAIRESNSSVYIIISSKDPTFLLGNVYKYSKTTKKITCLPAYAIIFDIFILSDGDYISCINPKRMENTYKENYGNIIPNVYGEVRKVNKWFEYPFYYLDN